MMNFPTNKAPIELNSQYETILLYVVQCFREGNGFSKLAHVFNGGFATLSLIVADDDLDFIPAGIDYDEILGEVVA